MGLDQLRPDGVLPPCAGGAGTVRHPLGAVDVERQAAPVGSVLALRPPRSDPSAPELGWLAHRLAAVSGRADGETFVDLVAFAEPGGVPRGSSIPPALGKAPSPLGRYLGGGVPLPSSSGIASSRRFASRSPRPVPRVPSISSPFGPVSRT